MFAELSNSSDEAVKQNVLRVTPAVDTCIHVFDTVCHAIYGSPWGYEQFTIHGDALQFQSRDDTPPFGHR